MSCEFIVCEFRCYKTTMCMVHGHVFSCIAAVLTNHSSITKSFGMLLMKFMCVVESCGSTTMMVVKQLNVSLDCQQVYQAPFP